MANDLIIPDSDVAVIQNKICVIREVQVMLDRDLAELYGVETRVLNQAVRRNIERFPSDFMFQLSEDECSSSQIVTLNGKRGSNLKYLPYAFTENGIAMLSSVLRSRTAIEVNIRIMRAFVAMRRMMASIGPMLTRLETIERRQIVDQIVTSRRGNHIQPGEIWAFNTQYGGLSVRTSPNFHDRFVIIDDKVLYLFGASLKDLGKKCFAFTRLDSAEIPNLKARI